MGKSKERKIKNQKKMMKKMNQRNESNIRAFNLIKLKQFQEIDGNNFHYTTIVSKYDGSS